MQKRFAFPAIVLALSGFILFLLVTLSPPYIRGIYLVGVKAGSGTDLRFGVYGECYRFTASWSGYPATPAAGCDNLGLGYEAFVTSTGRPGPDGPSKRPVIASAAVSRGLAMNPVTTFFAGCSVIWTVSAYLYPSSRLPKASVGVLFLTTIFAWSAFAIDLALALMARERLSHLLGISGYLGNGLWLALGGAVAVTAAMLIAGFGAFSSNANKNRQADKQEGC